LALIKFEKDLDKNLELIIGRKWCLVCL